ncbi:MAG: hypothetical protein ACI9X4_002371 [Glaciecola sp.]|jgi:hypothetical protein
MLLPLLTAIPLCMPLSEPNVTRPHAAQVQQAGAIDWFPGPLFAIKAKAEREKKGVLFVSFKDGSSGSDKLFQTTLADPNVQAQLSQLICVKIDLSADSDGVIYDKNSERIAARFPVRSYPTMLYVGASLQPEDFISGYVPPQKLVIELQRMLAGTNILSDLRAKFAAAPRDVDAIWNLATKCEAFGYESEHQKLMKRIWKLDPDGKSRPMRLQNLRYLQARLLREYTDKGIYDHRPLLNYLGKETNASVAFTGWSDLGGLVRTFQPNLKTKKGKRAMGRLSRDCYREAWKVVGPADKLNFALQALTVLYQDREELNPKDLVLVHQLADGVRLEIKGRSDTPIVQATFADAQAMASFLDGKTADATQWIDKAMKLDPTNATYAKRKQELATAKK